MNNTLLLIFTVLVVPVLRAQGPLTTPLAPAPTMKTLGQIEPRLPIAKGPAVPVAGPHFTISEPGSYYLTGNITMASGHGIVISASDVTLDLNGFTLKNTNPTAPTATSGTAILLSAGVSGVTIRNGHIRSGTVRTPSTAAGVPLGTAAFSRSGWFNGVGDTLSSPSKDTQLLGLSITGCGSNGVMLNGTAHLHEVTAMRNAGVGLRIESGTISRCEACYNEASGIAGQNVTATGIICRANGGNGINASTGTVADAVCSGNVLNGISVTGGGIIGAVATANGHWGVIAGKVTGVNANDNNMVNDPALGGIKGDDISQSVAIANKGIGIQCDNGTVQQCVARNSTTGFKIDGTTVRDCTAYGMLGNGMVGVRASLSNVSSSDNGSRGFDLAESTISNANCYSNSGNGISLAKGTITCLSARQNSYGIHSTEANVIGCNSNANTNGILAGPGVVALSVVSGIDSSGITGTALRDGNIPQP